MTRPLRALVVEDLEILRSFLETVLRSAGFAVVTAHVYEAEARFGEGRFDLVCLPGRDGVHLVPVIRALDPKVVVIVLSSDPRYEARALAAGAHGFINKGTASPIEEITRVLHRLGFGKGGDTPAP
jgi:DNA-binding response OmpR family regulator